jgi:type II secretory pathway pseudopilin PulG
LLAQSVMRDMNAEAGFLLLESLIATAIVATAFGVLTHLAVMAARANRTAAMATQATLLASEQAEMIAGDLSAGGLPLAPADSLIVNRAGFFDLFDARGRPLGSDASAPDAELVRRWTIRPLPLGPPSARLVLVVVSSWNGGLSLAGRRSELARAVIVRAQP